MWCAFKTAVSAFFLLATFSAAPALAQEKKTLLVFGDSLVAGYGLKYEESLPQQLGKRLEKEKLPVRVAAAGVSGDTTTSGMNRLDYALRNNNPDYVMVVLGGNDMMRGVDPVVTRENLRRILDRLQEQRIPVLLAGMRALGEGNSQLDAVYVKMYQMLARQYDAILYPFILEDVALKPELNQQDGVHPTAEGIGVIVDKLLPYLADLFVKEPASREE